MPVPNYAVAGLGISGRINPIDRFYFQLALFDGNPSHIGSDGKDDNIHGTDFRWHSEEGLFISLEAGYDIGKEYKGTYKLGIGYHTADFVRLHDPLHEKSGNYCYYLIGDQNIYKFRGDVDLNGFVKIALAPDDINAFSLSIEGGFCIQGLFGRKEDHLGLGVTHVVIESSDSETVIELTYKMQLSPWLTLQPDAQYIITPSGDSSGLKDAFVLGLRFVATF